MNTAVNSLGHIDNVVPSDLKRTFNFKGRKAIDIAARLIKRLTLDNDIVLDPVGSGSFVLACALINRRIIGCELDNYTYDALRILLEKYNQDLFKKLYTQVKEDCFENIMRLYITECFGIKNYIDKLYFDLQTDEYYKPPPHRDIKGNHTVVLTASCPVAAIGQSHL